MRDGVPYPVKAFLVFGNNTLTTFGNAKQAYEALMKLDLLVVADLFMTPTCELADIVLPAASWPELDQLAALPTIAGNVVLAQRKAVRVGECKADEEIFIELARKMKLPVGTEDLDVVLGDQLARGCGMPLDELRERGFLDLPMRFHKYKDKGFKTPTGKLELYSTRLEAMGYDPLPYYEEPPESPLATPDVAKDFPLVLTSGARIPFFFNSEHRQIRALRRAYPNPIMEVHPRHRGVAGHQERRLGLDRDAARQDPAEGQGHRRHRPSRGPRRARLVVPRGAGPGSRRLAVERERADAQRPALRPGDGHLPPARIAVPHRAGATGDA